MNIIMTLLNILKSIIGKFFTKIKNYLSKKTTNKIKTIKPMILIIAMLFLILGITFSINSNFLFKKTYENQLSFVEVNTNPPTKNSSAAAKVSLKSEPSWAWPTEGANCYISQYFHSGHKAIDIAGCGHGSNIHAAHDGVIVTAGSKHMNGNYIVLLQDNGYHTMYAHLSGIYVTVNQRVTKGQVIGAMGSTGYSTGTHLDFSVWKNGYPYYGGIQQNPLNFY